MTLKPIPRLILIIAVIGAAAYGVNKYLETRQSKSAAAPAQVVTIANDNSGAPGKTVTVAAANGTTGGSNTYQTIVDKGVVRVSVQSPSKPFFFVDNGVPQGFNYDFLKILFSQTQFNGKSGQITLDTDHMVDTYPAVPEALLKNDNRGNPTVDIAIDGLTFSDDDLPGVVYSIPYVDDFGYALITSSSSSIKSVTDMNGVTIGILKGDPDVKAYVTRMFPKVRIVELSDASINGERSWINHFIKEGQVDAVVYDYPFAVAEIGGTNLQFAVSKLPESDLKYKIGMRKGDTQLLENINTAIRKVKASPDYVNLIKKYFTSSSLAKVRTASSSEAVYVVKAGDTLLNIAAKLLNDKMRYREIESRNNIPNPNLIQVGQKLVIPKG
jgi:ABC-type amino acid transport substrate-binding protein